MDGSALEQKSSFMILWLCRSLIDWGSHIISIAKTASKKIDVLTCSMKFLSSWVALYLHKSTIILHEIFCHVWGDGPGSYLKLLHML